MEASRWRRLCDLIARIENGLLAGLLLVVILAANGQILLRNLFEFTLVWIDPFLRVTVLWLALMGAMVATRERTHIVIGALTRFLPHQYCLRMERLLDICAAVICGVIAYFSFVLVQFEYVDGLIAFAAIPVWLCESIMPIAFAAMAFRFLLTGMLGSEVAASETVT